MDYSLDDIIFIMEKYTYSNPTEMGEQEDSTAPSTDGYPTVTKWETGLTRANANTIDPKSTWKSLNKINRGKANTLL